MVLRLSGIFLLAVILFSGCAARAPKPAPAPAAGAPASQPKPTFLSSALSGFGVADKVFPPKPKTPQAQPPHLIGVVKMVNTEDRFVLIDAISYQGTETGAPLVCIMNQKETANLRLSSLRNPPFLIADIASGSPSPGDRVFKP